MRRRLPDRALVLVRPAVSSAASRRCCTGSPTTSGASISSSAGTPIPTRSASPERVRPRIHAMLGEDRPFDLEWISVYTFQCRRLERFVHGRVLFAGDAAHQVSPFGARGANSGVQDVDNLVWKLARVLRGQRAAALLDSYDAERSAAADENLLHSTRATDFITPKSADQPHVPRRRAARSRSGIRSRAGWSTPADCRCRPRAAASQLSTPDPERCADAMPTRRAGGGRAGAGGRPRGWLLGPRRSFHPALFDADDDAARSLRTSSATPSRRPPSRPSGAVLGQLIDFEGHAGAATTRGRARPTCCGPTSTSPARCAARSTACARPWARAQGL